MKTEITALIKIVDGQPIVAMQAYNALHELDFSQIQIEGDLIHIDFEYIPYPFHCEYSEIKNGKFDFDNISKKLKHVIETYLKNCFIDSEVTITDIR